MSDHIDDSTTDEEIEATVMRDRERSWQNIDDDIHKRALYRIEVLEERIAKAKAILCATIPQSQLALEIIRAVDALEGK